MGFDLALEEEEASTAPHGSETVGWLAVEPGQGSWSGQAYEADQTPNAVRHTWYGITFAQNFGSAPHFVAAMTTFDGGDSAQLRYDRTSLTASGVQVMVEEDTTDDSETGHTTEVVGYLALEGDGTLRGRALASTVTKYYHANGQRIAMRRNGVVYYLHGDHLGSTSLVTSQTSNVIARRLYDPYGETRWSEGTLPTEYQFTGQRHETGLGLYDYKARYYDPYLGRFVSADTIVPETTNPQALNRYSYVNNQPLICSDPDGHCPLCVTAAVGALAGGVVNLGFQTMQGMKSGQTFQEAVQDVDYTKVAGAAVAGGVMGATMGAGAAVLGTGLGATLVSGAAGGVIGGQAGALTEATIPEAIDVLNRGGWNGQRFMQTARQSGFLDPRSIKIDAAAGAISAGFGHSLTKLGVQAGLISEPSQATPIKTIVGIYPKQGMVFIQVDNVAYQLPRSTAEKLMRALGSGSWETARGILEEAVQTGTEETLEDAASP